MRGTSATAVRGAMNDTEAGVWMTYDEIAVARRIERIGAVRLVQRHRWRRQAGNDGKARILVPHDALEPRRGARIGGDTTKPGDAGNDTAIDTGISAPDSAGTVTAFETALTALREAKDGEITTLREAIAGLQSTIAGAEERAGRAEARVEAERARVDRAEATAVDQQQRADALRERLNTAETEATALREAVDGLRADISQTICRAERAEAEQHNAETRALQADSS